MYSHGFSQEHFGILDADAAETSVDVIENGDYLVNQGSLVATATLPTAVSYTPLMGEALVVSHQMPAAYLTVPPPPPPLMPPPVAPLHRPPNSHVGGRLPTDCCSVCATGLCPTLNPAASRPANNAFHHGTLGCAVADGGGGARSLKRQLGHPSRASLSDDDVVFTGESSSRTSVFTGSSHRRKAMRTQSPIIPEDPNSGETIDLVGFDDDDDEQQLRQQRSVRDALAVAASPTGHPPIGMERGLQGQPAPSHEYRATTMLSSSTGRSSCPHSYCVCHHCSCYAAQLCAVTHCHFHHHALPPCQLHSPCPTHCPVSAPPPPPPVSRPPPPPPPPCHRQQPPPPSRSAATLRRGMTYEPTRPQWGAEWQQYVAGPSTVPLAQQQLLNSQQAQMESARQAHSLWFANRQRQLTAGRPSPYLVPAPTPYLGELNAQVTMHMPPPGAGRSVAPYFMVAPHTAAPAAVAAAAAAAAAANVYLRAPSPMFAPVELGMLVHAPLFFNGGGAEGFVLQAAASEPQPVGASRQLIDSCTVAGLYDRPPSNSCAAGEPERCTVCLCDFEQSDEIRTLRCAHLFHVDCIDRWLVYNKKCPVCRFDMDSDLVSAAV